MCVLYCLVLVVIQLCVLSSTFGCEVFFFFFFKQKTAYEMRISDWSSDVCSSDLDRGHYTVYLPAYDDARLLIELMRFPDMQWQVFSKHNKTPFEMRNVRVQPIANEAFIQSMAASAGVLCGAGFETPAEALFMKKKLLVVPMKNQYEQHLNAAALEEMGVPVIKSLKAKNDIAINAWLNSKRTVTVDYPD